MDAAATRRREVSCLALTFFYDYLESHGRSRRLIQEDLPYPPSWLDDRLNWIDYPTFLEIERRLAAQFTDVDDLFFEIGLTFAATKGLGFTRVLVRGLLSPYQVYGRIPALVAGFLFPFVKITFERQPGGVRGTYVFDEPFPPSQAFLDTVKGILSGVPQIMGAPAANVVLSRQGTHTAVFDVRVSQWTGLADRVRGWLGTLSTAPKRKLANLTEVASELEEANRLLQEKVAALTDAKAELDGKVRDLTLLNEVAQATSGHLELRPLVSGAVRAIAAGWDRVPVVILLAEGDPAGLVLAAHVYLQPLEQRELRGLANAEDPRTLLLTGQVPPEAASRAWRVRVGGRQWIATGLAIEARLVGVLLLGAPEADPGDPVLLRSIASHLAIAIENARSYRVIADLRDHLEIRVRERTAELEEARTSLQDTVLRLEQADRAKADFFTYISHDLRTPLQLIVGPLDDMELQIGQGKPEDMLGNLRQARANALTLRNLVDELLDFAKIDAGLMQIEQADVELVTLAALVVDTLRPLADRREIHLSAELPDYAVPVVGDASLLRRVLVNLLGNALKYVRPTDRVVVRVCATDHDAFFEVQDTGPGVSEADQHRIFERFTRGANASSAGGSGIGLAMARDIVRAHGGTIELLGTATGAHFRVRLARGSAELPPPAARPAEVAQPRRAEAIGEDESVAFSPSAPVTEQASRARHHILIAEDNAEMRAFLTRVLRRDNVVRSVENGALALELIEREPPDIVISDVMMPGIDGLELCRRLKSSVATRGIPVILVSARHGSEAVLAAFSAGADDYLTKPFSPPELLARVNAQIRIRSLAVVLFRMEKQYSLGVLSAGIAHELLNPVSAVVNAVPSLRRNYERLGGDLASRDARQTAALLDAVEVSGQRMHTVVKGMLAYTRQDSAPRARSGRLSEEIEAVLTILRYRLHDTELEKQFVWDEPILHFPEWIDQILMNLIANALDAMPNGGRLVLRLERIEGDVYFRVHDSGPGVPLELRERIFTPFFTTKPPGKGTGLGLAIAREIVALHRGSIEVDHTVGRGACFVVRLPVEQASLTMDA